MSEADRRWRDRGLHEAVLAGDERAWQTWYDESYAALERYVVWRCGGSRDLADEAIQDTWLTAVRRVGHFDPGRATFAAWLRGIAANMIRNLLRKSRPATRGLAGMPAKPQTAEPWRVAEALAELPEHYERVLRMKYLDGRSVDEIAAEGGETPKAVESLLTRARAAFRTAYGSPEDAP
jgi:RNA polymerase sigma-70 factor (ECF subfamily)